MNRALGVLTCGAFLSIVLGVLGSGEPVAALVLGAVFAALAIAGFGWVRTRGGRAWAAAYVVVALPLAFVTFTIDAGVGTTLFLVVLVSQCVLLRLPLPVIALVIAVVPLVHLGMSLGEGLREGLGTLVSVLFAAVITELLLREQRSRGELAEAHGKLRGYAAQAERLATAQERNRVARDIHDGLGHALTVVQMQVKAARAVLPTDPAKADEVLAKAQEQAEAALAEVRRSVTALREPRSAPPLPEALQALVAETSAAGVPAGLTVSGVERDLPEEHREALYRAAQEGLTNVRKHASAGRADVVLDYTGGSVRVEVRDDGAGTDGGRTTGFGLLGLQERAAHLGGTLEFTSAPGEGSTLRMEVPR
ncbi:sensor histidine kinase [Amycolatopsis australiensis]|uniref:Oxygen sensor histidine kinase NreB n=1 Tax=Amycolatopsis australiensis TaxID=546364 RepID=A0A1K1SB16_9PSEU|nr:sensor histidine kinase [Amycolatopsis australiensis]SFW81292.1 Signal transduction histidine kinase [Amycolatopsis australiensis]